MFRTIHFSIWLVLVYQVYEELRKLHPKKKELIVIVFLCPEIKRIYFNNKIDLIWFLFGLLEFELSRRFIKMALLLIPENISLEPVSVQYFNCWKSYDWYFKMQGFTIFWVLSNTRNWRLAVINTLALTAEISVLLVMHLFPNIINCIKLILFDVY